MKFTTSFLTVLAATATLAAPPNKECMDVYMKKYGDCRSLAENDEYNESYCKLYETEICQKLYNNNVLDIISEFPECKGVTADEEELKRSDKERIIFNNLGKIVCTKDEQGNFCPYSPANTQTSVNISNNKGRIEEIKFTLIGALKESCKSKKCVDEFQSVLENAKKIASEEKNSLYFGVTNLNINDVSSIINSETCAARYAKTNANGNNNVNASNGNANGNVVTSSGNANGSSGNSNDKTNATNGNANGKTDEKNGATQVTFSSVLFISLAVVLSTLL